MKKRWLFLVLILILGVCVGLAAGIPGLVAGPPRLARDLVILYTNDVHCAVDGTIGYGGLAALERQYEDAGCDVLLVDNGDACQGAPIGMLSSGAYLIDIMNQLPYDLAIPGNHEFDYGMEQFLALTRQADFPYLCVNLTDLRSGASLLPGTAIKEFNWVKIGFVGVTTPQSLTSSNPTSFQDEKGQYIYGFCQDESGSLLYGTIQTTVDGLRQQGADYVILLAHLGISANASPWTSTEVIAHTSGIDAVLDGHSHSVLESERVLNLDGRPVLLSSTGNDFNAVGLLRLTTEGTLSSRLLTEVTEKDAALTAYVAQIQDSYRASLRQVVGSSQVELTINQPGTDTRIIRNAETNLGDLCADAFRAAGHSDLALINGGAIRAAFPAGEIDLEQIITTFPYCNSLCVLEVSGQVVLDALEMGCRIAPEENGGFLQVSGLSYTFDTTIPSPVLLDENGQFAGVEGQRRVSQVLIDGQPLDPTALYTLTGVDYMLLDSGDGFSMFQGCTVLQSRFVGDSQALRDYINGPLQGEIGADYAEPGGQGRILGLGLE